MAVINWDSRPANDESLGLGDDVIRSLKTSLQVGLDDEHIWPSTSGDAGKHRQGSAKVYVGVQSLVSSVGTDGKLMVTSDTSRLFHVGSGGTSFVGGITVISAGSFPGAVPQRAIWVEEFGEGATKSATTVVTIPNSGYSGKPFVSLTAMPLTPLSHTIVLTGVTATTFTVGSFNTADTSSAISFFWRSIGTRTL